MKSESHTGVESYKNAEVNGTEHNLCKNVEVLRTKTRWGPTQLDVKCALGKNMEKKIHGPHDARGRLTADKGKRPPHPLMALALFPHSLSHVLCLVLLSAVCARHLVKFLPASKGQCSPWRSALGCGLSYRSCRGCVHPRGSSPGYPLLIGDHRNPHNGSSACGSHGPEPRYGQSPPGPGLA